MSRSIRLLLATAVFTLLAAGAAGAQTRLFVPRFAYGPGEDTQVLLSNRNDNDSTVDLWAFTSKGELLGQFQLSLKGHATRALTLGEGFHLDKSSVTGWLGVVSPDTGIQLSYSLLGADLETTENSALTPLEWISNEVQLNVKDAASQSLSLSNPNSFGAQVTITARSQDGRVLGVRDLSMPPFGQVAAGVAQLLGGSAAKISIWSNADLVSRIDDAPLRTTQPEREPRTGDDLGLEEQVDLVLQTDKMLGAYQVTVEFDPSLVQFNTNGVSGGSADGFDSRPLVVNLDNVAGRLTLGSFQVGASPSGRLPVARLAMKRSSTLSARFTIRLDAAADEAGSSLAASDVAVGLVHSR